MRNTFEITTVLPIRTEELWNHCSSMQGVSRELWPLLRMTYPEGLDSLVPDPFVPGQALFRSRLLLFGVLPVDWSELTLVELEPGRRFLERSPMATQALWEHERVLEPTPEGTRITDRLKWRGRFPGAGPVFGLAVPVLFKWRHRRRRALFG
jgi:hypothetical protein